MCSELGPPRLDTLPSIATEIEIEREKGPTTPQRKISAICCGTGACLPYWGNGLIASRWKECRDADMLLTLAVEWPYDGEDGS